MVDFLREQGANPDNYSLTEVHLNQGGKTYLIFITTTIKPYQYASVNENKLMNRGGRGYVGHNIDHMLLHFQVSNLRMNSSKPFFSVSA